MLGEVACGEASEAMLGEVAHGKVGEAMLSEVAHDDVGKAMLIKIHVRIRCSSLEGDVILSSGNF